VRLLRIRRFSWRRWITANAKELRALEDHRSAEALEACGRRAWTSGCPRCGLDPARVVVMSSCDSRICPFCGRSAAKRRTEVLTFAVRNVRRCADAAVHQVAREQRAAERDAARRVDHWAAKVAAARAKGRDPGRALALLEKAEDDRSRAHSWLLQAWHRNDRVPTVEKGRRRMEWGGSALRWRFLTLTHWWDPSDPDAIKPGAMRTRVRALFRQWSRVWSERLSVGGLAAATAKCEMSANGFIHLHVLYWGPFVVKKYVEKLQAELDSLAGFTWVQLARDHEETLRGQADPEDEGDNGEWAAAEIAKYTAKAISPLSADWIAGDGRPVLHPRLAAAWQVATRGVQLVRHFGTMRAAIALYKQPDDDGHWRCCVGCGHDLGMVGLWSHEWTDAIARAARSRWRDVLAIRAEDT
jgi:hypothetical protein